MAFSPYWVRLEIVRIIYSTSRVTQDVEVDGTHGSERVGDSAIRRKLVFSNGRVHAIGPGVDSASQAAHMRESGLIQQLNRLRTTRPHLA